MNSGSEAAETGEGGGDWDTDDGDVGGVETGVETGEGGGDWLAAISETCSWSSRNVLSAWASRHRPQKHHACVSAARAR